MNEENISFEELLNNSMKENQELEKVTEGTVINVSSKGEIFVDLNYKADGIIPKSEYSDDENVDPAKEVKAGDKIKFEILKLNDGLGNVLLSCKRLKSQEAKKEFEEKVENNAIFEEKVNEVTDKGLVVNINGIRVFIPNSLSCGQKDVARFKIIEYNPKERKIIGSCKAVLDEIKEKAENDFWSNAEVGKKYEGVVSSICSYGAFVDINGVQGLLHISEISWNRDAKVQDILTQGQKINVTIKELDKENKRIKLSYEGKGVDPWENINYKVGDIVRVKIRKFMHISQICEERISKPEEKLQIGEEVNAKIIDINLEKKKIELSIKELEGTSNEYSSINK